MKRFLLFLLTLALFGGVTDSAQQRYIRNLRVDEMVTKAGLTYDIKAYGAKCNGSFDDTIGIQAAVDAAEAAVTTNGAVTFDYIGSPIIQLPLGDCLTTAAITIEMNGIIFQGVSNPGTTIHVVGGTEAISVGDGIGNWHGIVVRDMKISYDNDAYTGVTGWVAASADTAVINIDNIDEFRLEDLTIRADPNNVIQGLTAVKILESERWIIRNLDVEEFGGHTSGNEAIGISLDTGTANHGPFLMEDIYLNDVQVGFKVVDTGGSGDGGLILGLKIVNGALDGATNNSKYGVWMGSSLRNFTFINTHIEGYSSNSFDEAVRLDADLGGAGAIRNISFHNLLISRATKAFVTTGTDIDNIQLSNVMFSNAATYTVAFEIGANTTDSSIIGVQGGSGTFTGCLTDSSAAGSRNLFKWTDGDCVLTGDFIYKGDMIYENLQLDVGSFYVKELAAAAGDTAAYGQFWVENTAPAVPRFTDDAGADFHLGLITVGDAPATSGCTPGQIHFDTNEAVDTNCTTTADNSMCFCEAGTWVAFENN